MLPKAWMRGAPDHGSGEGQVSSHGLLVTMYGVSTGMDENGVISTRLVGIFT
jgi:hypothetical protein